MWRHACSKKRTSGAVQPSTLWRWFTGTKRYKECSYVLSEDKRFRKHTSGAIRYENKNRRKTNDKAVSESTLVAMAKCLPCDINPVLCEYKVRSVPLKQFSGSFLKKSSLIWLCKWVLRIYMQVITMYVTVPLICGKGFHAILQLLLLLYLWGMFLSRFSTQSGPQSFLFV